MKKGLIYAAIAVVVAALAIDFVQSQNNPQRGYFFTIFANKIIVSDSARVNGPLKLVNKLTVGTLVAVVDSFTALKVADTVTISGAATTDLYLVTPRWNGILVDTVPYNVRSTSTGAIVSRGAVGQQSAANYTLFRVAR